MRRFYVAAVMVLALSAPLPARQSDLSSTIDDEYASGARALAGEEYTAAIAAFTRVLALTPRHAPALVGRGNAWLADASYQRALDDYNRAVDADGRYAEAYLARGTLRWLAGQLRQAEDDFTRAVALAPDDEFYYNRLATVLYERRKPDDVLKMYERAYRADRRRSWAVWGGLGVLAGKREWEPLRLAVNRLIDEGESSVALPYYLAQYYAHFDDHQEVITRLDAGLRRDADRMPIDTYLMLATAYNGVGNWAAYKKNLHEYYDRSGLDFPGLGMSGIPAEAARHLRDLAMDSANIKSAAFSDSGSWVVVDGFNGWRSVAPRALSDRLLALSSANRSIDSVAFAPGGGWIVVGNGAYWESGIPDGMRARLAQLTADGYRIDWVTIGPDGAWVVHYSRGSGGIYHSGLTPRALAAIDTVFKTADLRAMAIGPGERFVVRSNRDATDWYTGVGMSTFMQSLVGENKPIDLFAYAGASGWVAYSATVADQHRQAVQKHRH